MSGPLFTLAFCAAILASAPSSALDPISIDVDCPEAASAGTTPEIIASVENRLCTPQAVRLISSMVGNGNQTLDGVSIIGPDVVVTSAIIPAATASPSTCSFGSCTGTTRFVPCATSADCACANIVPGTASVAFYLPAPIPSEFAHTVMEQYTFLDVPGSAEQNDTTCRIAVPEASATAALWLGWATLSLLAPKTVGRARARLVISSSTTSRENHVR